MSDVKKILGKCESCYVLVDLIPFLFVILILFFAIFFMNKRNWL